MRKKIKRQLRQLHAELTKAAMDSVRLGDRFYRIANGLKEVIGEDDEAEKKRRGPK
jgi:hypothetical protein